MARLAPLEFAQFNGLLASAVERQLPLAPAIELLAAQTRTGDLRRGLEHVARALHEGRPLPEALAGSPDVFPPEYVALLDAGLRSGRLAQVLRHAETYDGLRARVARRVKQLLGYLAMGALVLLTIVTVLSIVGGRQSAAVRQALQLHVVPAPLEWVESYWWVAPAAFTIAVLLLCLVTLSLRRWSSLSRLVLWIPLWRRLVISRDLALFSTTTAIRLSAGAPLRDALADAGRAVVNPRIQRRIRDLGRRVEDGEGLSTALFYDTFFPRTLAWAVSMGEARGEVAEVFDMFSRLYAAELDRNFGLVLQILTPLGLIALGNVALLAGVLVMTPFTTVMQVF